MQLIKRNIQQHILFMLERTYCNVYRNFYLRRYSDESMIPVPYILQMNEIGKAYYMQHDDKKEQKMTFPGLYLTYHYQETN